MAKASQYRPYVYAIMSEFPWRNFPKTYKSTDDRDMQIRLDFGSKCGTGVSDAIASFSPIARLGEHLAQNQEWIHPSECIALRFFSIGAGHIAGAWDHFGGVHPAVQLTMLIASIANRNGVKVWYNYDDRRLKSFTPAAQLQMDIELEKNPNKWTWN